MNEWLSASRLVCITALRVVVVVMVVGGWLCCVRLLELS